MIATVQPTALSLDALIHTLHTRGITLSAEGGRLGIRPAGALTPELREGIREHKAALLDILSRDPVTAVPASASRSSASATASTGGEDAQERGEDRAQEAQRVPQTARAVMPSREDIDACRAGLLAWGEAHGWPRLAIAFRIVGESFRVPYLWICEGCDGWRRFCLGCGYATLALALASTGLPVPATQASASTATASTGGEDRAQDRAQEARQGAQEAPQKRKREAPALGVLDPEGLWIGHAGGRVGMRRVSEGLPVPGCHAGALLALARREGLSQLWVHPAWHQLAGFPDQLATREERRDGVPHAFIADALAEGWNIRPAALAPWLHCFRRGEYGAIELVCPLLWRNAESGNAWNGTRWHEARDGRELLAALLAYATATGTPFYRSPGATGTGLLRRMHSSRTALDLSAYASPEAFPMPARRRGVAVAHDIKWARPLTPQERGRQYLHGYDKNAMYLGACSSLAVGFGPADHVTGEGIVCDGKAPGYWLASIRYDCPPLLPHPFLPGGTAPRYGAKAPEAPRWYPTPFIELAQKLGASIEIQEAYVWGASHRALEPWYRAMRDAREALSSRAQAIRPDENAPALALAALKATYTQSIGWLDGAWMRKSEAPEDLYRPDWRHTAIAQATANFWRQLARVYRETGAAPVAIGTDCAYYVSDERDAIAACPAGLRLGQGLGEYKVKAGGEALAPLLPVLDQVSEGVHAAEVVKHLQSALKIAGEDEGEE